MRVLQLVTTPRPFFDDQVAALERHGVDCTTLAVPNPEDRSPLDYARFLRRTRVEAADYDLVHANYGLTAPAAFAAPTEPVVLTLWGTDLMSDRRWLTALSRAAARRADAAIVPSWPMAERLDCPYRRIPFGVDTDRFRPVSRSVARDRVGWPDDETVVLFPYDTDRAVKDHPRAEQVVESLDVDATLRAVSGVPHDRMPDYLNASDALLVTSERESGPMVVKEAAACNVPVVSTDVGFVRSVLDGVTNSAVCSSDAELVAALEAALASDGRSNGREAVRGLSADDLGVRLRQVYESVLE